MRPIKKEFWMMKGMTELESSEIFLKQFFTKNNIDRKKLSKKDIKNIIIELYEKENFGKKLLKKIDKTKTYYYLSIVYDIELEKLIEENINFSNDVKQNKWGIYTQYDNITGKLLRSSLEIVFCELLKKHNIKYEIGIQYPNSRMFCDFYLPEIDQWIEIAGMMADEKYRQKMKFKQKTFGSVILEPKDINNYFKGLL